MRSPILAALLLIGPRAGEAPGPFIEVGLSLAHGGGATLERASSSRRLTARAAVGLVGRARLH